MRVGKAADTNSEMVGTMREGKLAQKHLLFGEDGSPNNYDLNMGRAGSGGWRTPRHRHNFDQIRYVIKGVLPYGENQFLKQGWVGYFPESVPYGPQDRSEGLETLVLQLGGASGFGYLSVAQRESTNAILNEKGEFRKGLYYWKDENGNEQSMDGSDACFEHATGRKLQFAEPRYTDVIAMNPDAFDWLPEGSEGVSVKWLGTFTERNMRIGFVRLDANAVFGAGQHPSLQVLYLTKGRLAVGNDEYGPETGFELLANEGPVAMRALEPTELLCVVFPQF